MTRWTRASAALVTLAAAFCAVVVATAAAAPGVTPSSVSATLLPGQSQTISKSVETPAIPPNPDIFFLADSTGSMGGAIANVRANAVSIMNQVLAAQPTAQFGAGEYRDFGDAFVYRLNQAITASTADAAAGINQWVAFGGGDTPEAQLFALHSLATSPATGFRPASSRIVVWFGDAPGHDPSGGITEAASTAALQAAGVRVIAISTGFNQLDLTGQATRIANATGGTFLSGASDSQVAAAILAGLSNLPATVTHSVSCPAGVSATLSPASQTTTSGGTVSFSETYGADATALPGTYVCTADFLVNGVAGGAAFRQTLTITVVDVTPPTASCRETSNPSGANVPRAGSGAGRSGQNPDGFYVVSFADDVAVGSAVLADSASAFTVAVSDGERLKVVQAPGATPSWKPGAGAISKHVTLRGDAVLRVTDTSGNLTEVSCRVPPPPK